MNDIGGLVLSFCVAFCGLLYYTYDNLEYKGYQRNSSCTGQCYADYVAEHGTVVEQLLAKQEAAAEEGAAAGEAGPRTHQHGRFRRRGQTQGARAADQAH